MRKRLLQLLAALCVGVAAKAEVISNYEYNFDDPSISQTGYAPLGWGRLSDGGVYSFTEDGRSGSCLNVVQTDPYPYDCIIAPPFTGQASIYVRANSSDGYVKFRSVAGRSENRFGWDSDEIKNFTTPALVVGEWVKVDLPVCSEGERIGIQLHNAAMDDFFAPSADITAYEKLNISRISRVGSGNLNGDAFGNFEYEYDITLQNAGEVSYTPGDANYTLSHYFNSPTSESKKDVEIPEPLAPGEDKTMRVKVVLQGGNEMIQPYLYIGENITGSTFSAGRITYIPYIPEIKLGVTGTGNEYYSSPYRTSEPYAPYLSFGTVYDAGRREKKITIKNTAGAAPLTITDIKAEGEGFSVAFSNPLTIEAGESQDVTLSFAGEKPGIYRGSLTIITGEIGEVVSPLAAAVPDDSKWHEGFEGEGNPAGFILSDKCEIADIVSAFGGEGHKKVIKIGGTAGDFITPKVKVAEGENLLLSGYSGYGDASFKVEYSADRENWTAAYNTAEATFENKFSLENYTTSEHLWSFLSVEGIPAGEWYIRVSGNDLVIDELYGFTLAEVGTEVYLNKAVVPTSGKVNYPYTASVEVVNLGKAISADNYSVALYFDEEVFASAESEDLAAGASKSFEFTAVPYEAGSYEAKIEVKVGEEVFSTDVVNLTIAPETAQGGEVVVGESTKTTQNGPITKDGSRKEEILYTKDYIDSNSSGLEAGSKISSITFRGAYVDGYETLPTVSSDIVVYMANTSTSKLNTRDGDFYSFSDISGMEKVYEGHVEIAQMEEGGDLFTLVLDEPFVYEGEGIDLIFEATTEKVTSKKGINYYGLSKDDNGCVAYSSSFDSATGMYSTYIPTIVFGLSGDVAVVSGRVTHASTSEPLADVAITLESPEKVVYKTRTDDNGEYTVSVLQPDKQYKLKAVKENMADYESPEFLDLSAMAATHHFVMNGVTTGVETIQTGALSVKAVKGALLLSAETATDVRVYDLLGREIINLDGFAGEKRIMLPAGIYVVNGRKVAVR